MKPLLLLDVDGVLNCFGSLWSDEYIAEHFVEPELAFDRYPIHCRKTTEALLARVLEEFVPVWATAWQEHAHGWWGPRLGLGDDWPHIPFTGGWVGEGVTWKLPDIIAWANERPGAPLAWVDDDLHDDAFTWAAQRLDAGVPTLLLKTKPHQGLTEAGVDRLLGFAEDVRAWRLEREAAAT